MTVEQFLNTSEIDSSDLRLFIQNVCSLSSSELITKSDWEIPNLQLAKLNQCIKKRLEGQSVAYILEEKGFYKSVFYTPVGVLVPRPDTETLVEEVLKTYFRTSDKETLNILDLCAGTGCIGISIALELAQTYGQINLHLSDISQTAFNCFSINADNLIKKSNIKVIKTCCNLFDMIKNEKFDIIVTNPPYIESEEIQNLSIEVQNEPHLALDGGIDGLDLIRKIVESAPSYLNADGTMFMEIGWDQGEKVKDLFLKNNFHDVEVVKDLGMNDRVVKGRI